MLSPIWKDLYLYVAFNMKLSLQTSQSRIRGVWAEEKCKCTGASCTSMALSSSLFCSASQGSWSFSQACLFTFNKGIQPDEMVEPRQSQVFLPIPLLPRLCLSRVLLQRGTHPGSFIPTGPRFWPPGVLVSVFFIQVEYQLNASCNCYSQV